MNILLITATEHSLKCSFYCLPNFVMQSSFSTKHIGKTHAQTNYTILKDGLSKSYTIDKEYTDVEDAIHQYITILTEHDLHDIDTIVYQLPHGGTVYSEPTIVSEHVIEHLHEMKLLSQSATESNLLLLLALQKIYPTTKQYAVFDTAFHNSIPSYEMDFALPKAYQHIPVKRFGFHGLSHESVTKQVQKSLLEKENERYQHNDMHILSCYLDSTMSVCAIKNGKSIAVSGGFSAYAENMLQNSSNDLDTAAVLYIAKEAKETPEHVLQKLQTQGGLFALTQTTNLAQIYKQSNEGCIISQRALTRFTKDIAKTIIKQCIDMPTIDALAFSGPFTREYPWLIPMITNHLQLLNIHIITPKHIEGIHTFDITAPGSTKHVYLVHEQEHLEIVRKIEHIQISAKNKAKQESKLISAQVAQMQ